MHASQSPRSGDLKPAERPAPPPPASTRPHQGVQPLQVLRQVLGALHIQEALDDVGGLEVADGAHVPASRRYGAVQQRCGT